MDTFLGKVKDYDRALTAHEQTKLNVINEQRRKFGDTETRWVKNLQSIGIDTDSVSKDFARAEKELKSAHKIYFETAGNLSVALPGNFGILVPPDPDIFDTFPPCVDAWGGGGFTDEDCGFNLSRGETNFKSLRQGSGWGLTATAVGHSTSTLVFRLTPPRAGDVRVDAYIDFKGVFAISAHDHFYTSTNAKINLKVSSRLYQHYWEEGPVSTIIDEYHTDSSNSGVVDQQVRLRYSTSLSANDPVLVFVKCDLVIDAHSSHARAEIDFRTGASRHIRVPFIRFTYL